MCLRKVVSLGCLLLMVASLWSYVGCHERAVVSPWIGTTISGVVRDAFSGTPIDSASILVGDNEDTLAYSLSDSTGYYRATRITLGPNSEFYFPVTCSKAGYQSQADTVHSTPNRRTFDSVNFRLIPE